MFKVGDVVIIKGWGSGWAEMNRGIINQIVKVDGKEFIEVFSEWNKHGFPIESRDCFTSDELELL